METRANYVMVGSSVLAALATIIVFVFWLGSRQLSHREEVYHTYFTGSVAGLAGGSPVRYRGVPVGTVGGIEIDPQNIERIRVTLKLRANTPVRTDTVASLETAGITGASYIELSGGTQASPALTTAMVTAIDKITIPALNAGGTNLAAIDTAKRNRVYSAVLLTLASPEFLVQK